jgi:translocation and assembly module TamB
MTNEPPHSSQENPPSGESRCLWQPWRRPAILGLGILGVAGVGTYFGVRVLVFRYLPQLVETQLQQITKRDVQVGKVTYLSPFLTKLRIGETVILPGKEETAGDKPRDRTQITIPKIEVSFNPFPLVAKQLPVRITVVQPNVYAAQDRAGNWVYLELDLPEGGELPIDLQLDIRIQDGEIVLLPYGAKKPLAVNVDTFAQLRDKNKRVRYESTVEIGKGKLAVKGETLVDTIQTKAIAQMRDLSLVEVNPFLAQFPVKIDAGIVAGNLNVELPSLKDWKSSEVRGVLRLKNLEVQTEALAESLTANGLLQFQGQSVRIDELRGELGDLAAEVTGSVGLKSGLDVRVDVPEVAIASLLNLVPAEVTVPVLGTLKANVKVTGEIENPQVFGTLRNGEVLEIDRTEFSELVANFSGNLSEAKLDEFRLIPAAGGEITARGQVGLEDLKLDFEADASLPVDALAQPYGMPTDIRVGNLWAQVDVEGTVDDPKMRVSWQLPGGNVGAILPVSGSGEAVLKGKKFFLEDTVLQVGEGRISALGKGDLESKVWDAEITSASLPLDRFFPIRISPLTVSASGRLDNFDPDSLQAETRIGAAIGGGRVDFNTSFDAGNLGASGTISQVQLDTLGVPVPVMLQEGRLLLTGRLDAWDVNSVQATADLDVTVNGGSVGAIAQLISGSLDVSANVRQIQVNTFIPDLPFSASLVDSNFNFRSSVNSLIAAVKSQDFGGVNATATARLGVNEGTIETTARLAGNDLSLVADAGQISVNSIVPELPVSVTLLNSITTLDTSVPGLMAAAQTQDFSQIVARSNVQLGINEGTVDAEVAVRNGAIDLLANSRQISLNSISPNLPMSARLVESQVNLNSSIATLLNAAETQDIRGITADVNAQLDVNGGMVYSNTKLHDGAIHLWADSRNIDLTSVVPEFPVSARLVESRVNLRSSVATLLNVVQTQDLRGITADLTAQLDVNGGRVTSTTQLRDGAIDLFADSRNISLNSIVPNLPANVALLESTLDFSASTNTLLAAVQNQDFSAIEARVNARLSVNEGTVNTQILANAGQLEIAANTTQLSLNAIAPEIPLAVTILNSQINANTGINALVAAVRTPTRTQNFNEGECLPMGVRSEEGECHSPLQMWFEPKSGGSLIPTTATAQVQLGVAEGIVNTTANLRNGAWQTTIDASQLNTLTLLSATGHKIPPNTNLPPLNAQLDLAGSLDSLLALRTIPVQVNHVSVQLGQEFLETAGSIVFSNPTTSLDIANVNLTLATRYNTQTLPLETLIAAASFGKASLPDHVSIAGAIDFDGRWRGQNLISNPLAPGNVNLTGNLELNNFQFNDIAFEPRLAGDVVVKSGEEIALNLRGSRDVIAARLEPCTRGDACLSPYLPTSFELRQGELPILARGQRRGDVLNVELENFDLALLNIAPATEVGIQGEIGGTASGEVAVNLFTLETEGRTQLLNPSLGYLQAKNFTGEFSYKNGVARLENSQFQLGESVYQADASIAFDIDKLLTGNFDLAASPIQGRIVADGRVQDLLIAAQFFTLEDLQRGITSPVYLSAEDLNLPSVGLPNRSLSAQLNLFAQINYLLQTQVAEIQTASIPTQLDIEGRYTSDISFGGTVGNPNANFDFQAENWVWKTQLDTVGESGQIIEIDRIVAQGTLENQTVTVNPAFMEIEGTTASFVGQASPTTQSGELRVENLSLETIGNFAAIPEGATGNINLVANLGGTRENPQVQGEVNFVDASWRGQPLDALVGEFKYDNDLFQFDSVTPNYLQANVRVPFPPTPKTNDRISVTVNVGTEATQLLPVLTNGQVEWLGGDATMQLQATALLDLEGDVVSRLLTTLDAQGGVTLDDATLKTPYFKEELTLDGAIAFDPSRINVENLVGNFGGSTLQVTGELPTFVTSTTVENPLTVALNGEDGGKLDIKGLFRGRVGGNVQVTGAAISPVIRGNIAVAEGRAIIPTSGGQTTLVATDSPSETTPLIVPEFDDFTLTIGDNFRVEKSPILNVRVRGQVNVNGTLDNLRPSGQFQLTRGVIQLFDVAGIESGLSGSTNNRFFVTRDHPQTVTFIPSQGILNPTLNLQLGTIVFEDRRSRLRDRTETEVPAPEVIPTLRPEQIKILVNVQGTAQELIAAMSDTNDLSSGAVTLTSIPQRSESSIVGLLGNRLFTSLEEITKLQGDELVQFAFLRFVVQPYADNILFDIEDFVSNVGQKVGLQDLRVFPLGQVEAVYDLTEDSSLTTIYDYEFDAFQFRYDLRF